MDGRTEERTEARRGKEGTKKGGRDGRTKGREEWKEGRKGRKEHRRRGKERKQKEDTNRITIIMSTSSR
jgi:hypothetical protein